MLYEVITHVPGKDPELSIAKPETLAQYLVYVSGVRTWERNFRAMFRNAFGRNEDVFVADKNRGLIRTEARGQSTKIMTSIMNDMMTCMA